MGGSEFFQNLIKGGGDSTQGWEWGGLEIFLRLYSFR